MPTQHITCKLGSMRKAKSWILYPSQTESDQRVKIQCDARIALIDLNEKKDIVSDGKKSHNCNIGLQPALGAKLVDVSDEIINELKEKLGKNHVGPVSILDL